MEMPEIIAGDFSRLPEGCVSHVLSLTSPRDACRAALVSLLFCSAAESDTVWDAFLPADLDEILARAVERFESRSKRALFFRLCDPILVDGGKMSFFLEKLSGRKCFMLSARQLTIIWSGTPHYWRWVRLPESRFLEVAELLDVCWLEIRGKLYTNVLSRHTKYAAYLVFKLVEDSRGFGHIPVETSVKVGAQESGNKNIFLQPRERVVPRPAHYHRRGRLRLLGWNMPLVPPPPLEEEQAQGQGSASSGLDPRKREDGWMEVELGEFRNEEGDDGEVEMSLMEVKGGDWKSGLIIEGIELRPKH